MGFEFGEVEILGQFLVHLYREQFADLLATVLHILQELDVLFTMLFELSLLYQRLIDE